MDTLDPKAAIATLNDLIETCKDGEHGFRACAEQAKSPALKAVFTKHADECALGATQLQAHVAQLGGSPDQSGSVAGALHRGWVAVRSTLSTYDDLAVLEECERGEDNALAAYRDALKTDTLPAPLRALVETQYAGVKRNHDEIRRLRDQLRGA